MAKRAALFLAVPALLLGGWYGTALGDAKDAPLPEAPSPLIRGFLAPAPGAPVHYAWEDGGEKKPAPEKQDEGGEKKKAAESGDTPQVKFTLQEGLVAKTTDDAFRFHVGGRVDWDSGWYNTPRNLQQSLNTPLEDGTDLRRFRLGIDGTAWQVVDFSLEADFSRASDFTDFKSNPQTNIFITNAWVALRDVPLVDTLRLGHQKEYLTFANATSAKWLPFMERPYIFDAFENPFSWDSGVSTNRSYFDQSVTSWLGVFWNGTRSQAFNVGGHYGVSGRLTWMPLYNEAAQQWLCLSASGSVRAFGENDPNSIIVRPLVRTGQSFDVPNLLATGAILTRDGLKVFGAGAHSAWGPLTVGGEFLCWSLANTFSGSLPNPDGSLPAGASSLGNLFLSGCYVEALYFLTPGDHRGVTRVIPGYDRVSPVSNFTLAKDAGGLFCRGTGTWELGVRFDHVNLNSGGLQAGTLDSVTVGVNWYLNPNTRITTNYVHTFRDVSNPAGTGEFDALGVRVHFDF